MSEQNRISRRRFLELVGGAAGAATLACAGVAIIGARPPEVEFLQSNCGIESETRNKLLVAYASRCGSTGEVAEAIGQVFCESEVGVDVCPVENVDSLSEYQAVVVGGAVRMRRLLPEMVKFVEMHQATLNQVPTAYFVCCGTLRDDTEANRRQVSSWMNPVRQLVEPTDVGLFAGKMDMSQLSLVDRTISQVMGGYDFDLRDWEVIGAWAESLRPAMLNV
jgi:menaquinone-dependent protoporphyrinogen oxidase